MVKKFTNIIQSPKKIIVDDIEVTPKLIMLRDLDQIKQYEKVDVKAKAIKVGCKVQVGNGKMKQDVIMADATGIGRLTLWEDDIGILDEGTSYKLSNIMVCIYQNKRYLSKPRDSSSVIEPLSDIEDVIDDDVDMQENCKQEGDVMEAEVIAVPMFQSYRTCISCKGKVLVDIGNDGLGRCTKCQTLQKLVKCGTQDYATIIVQSGERVVTLQAFGSIMKLICITEPLNEEALLMAPPFNAAYNSESVITSIWR